MATHENVTPRSIAGLRCPHARACAPPAARWSEAKANDWYAKQPWLVGSNYIPATAINELEMWQADTFDPKTIDKELGWAEGLGMTTMRVFLHDLAWQQDAEGYRGRIDRFLDIAARHHIRPLFVLFDSCWDPDPKVGRQRAPKPGVHNSGWLQSPGAKALQDRRVPRLKAYVTGVVTAFGKDSRVLGWDIWNEPDNTNSNSYGSGEPKNKVGARARVAAAGLRVGTRGRRRATADVGCVEGGLVERRQAVADGTHSARELGRDLVSQLRQRRRVREADHVAAAIPSSDPVHRVHGARKRQHVSGFAAGRAEVQGAAINWGFVAGKTQTYLPWDSWQKPYVDREPTIWFHEVFKQDGTPYRQDEVDLIRKLTGAGAGR